MVDKDLERVIVLDINSKRISTMKYRRALQYLGEQKAEMVCIDPLTIQLNYEIKEGSNE